MRRTVESLNKLYKPAFEKMDEMSKFLSKNCVDHALDFHYGHRIKIGKVFTNEFYPIPRIHCRLLGIKTEIFFDVYTTKNYIGYIKLYPSKEELLSIDMKIFDSLEYLVYGFYNYQEKINFKNLEEAKTKIKQSKEEKFIIYADFDSLNQIFSVIEKFANKPSQKFSMSNYKCDSGHYITIDAYNGSCPVCGKDSHFKRKFTTKCPVCGAKCLKDQYGNGECENCGWKLDKYTNKFKNRVIYPNLISLNKAKQLYSEGKPFEPDLGEFIEALHNYSEMQFEYNGVYYTVELVFDDNSEPQISLYNSQTKEITLFNNDEDFKNNAKVEGKLLKDIWDDTTDRYWLQ